MKCVKCDEEMDLLKEDVSNNGEIKEKYKEYNRTQYVCKKDDIWIQVETPNS